MVEHLRDINLRRALALKDIILNTLDSRKATDISVIELAGKSEIADFMIVASGTSDRHVSSVAEYVAEAIRESNITSVAMEGMESCEWVIIDNPYVIVHLFKPEARARYNLEKMWSADFSESPAIHTY